MIQPDRGDHADLRLADVRGVQPAAEARLEDGHVHPPERELDPGRGRDELEEGRGEVGLGRGDGRMVRPEDLRQGDDAFIRERVPVDLDPLADRDEVRTGVEAGPAAVGALDGLDHRARGALAVGAGDMETRGGALRVGQAGGEHGHPLRAEAGA